MIRLVYTALLLLLFPVLLLVFVRLSRKNKAWLKRFSERLGYLPKHIPSQAVWLHAASVGEVQASAPLVKAWQQAHPDTPIVISTFTPTGAEHVARVFGNSVQHVYLPLDYPWAVQGFLRALNPKVLVLMERELWPNLLAGCQHFNLPVVLANARLSENSLQGYKKFFWALKPMFSALSHVAAHSQADAERFLQLGIAAEKISVAGSVKFEIQVAEAARSAGQELREQWGAQRTVLALASSHEDEDEQLLELLPALQKHIPQLLLMLIPRHPERFEAVAKAAQASGFSLCRRSAGEIPNSVTQVYLGDTMGEMLKMLSAADVVIVGGTIIDDGGHNPIEPAALGKPVLMGPYFQHFASIVSDLQSAGALEILPLDAHTMQQQLASLLADVAKQQQMGAAGLQVVEQNRGAVDKLMRLIERWA